jgi:Cu/Ag efflux pump CusA
VLASPEKLLKYGLTVKDVVEAIEHGNANAGGGVIVRGWEQLYIRAVGLIKAISDIERVVLVAFFRKISEQGETVTDAVVKGCDLRFRPLLMTALTSFIGHLPMFCATTSGADIQKPLAVVVMGGLITSTVLTLFVLPCIYALFSRSPLKEM